jgi:type I restriction enzyme R subunit
MPNRPSIPAEIEREILVESGHRCAVCGASCPLERAHIIPWHKSKEHKAEDLICLCASCHERADLEKWGEKILREYKWKPWVLRQFGTNAVSTVKVESSISFAVYGISTY